jgi:hypothetical protein
MINIRTFKVVLEDQAFEASWGDYLGRAEDQAVEIMLSGGSAAHRCPRPRTAHRYQR